MGFVFLIIVASFLFSAILFIGFWPAMVFNQLPFWFRGFTLLMWGTFVITGVILGFRAYGGAKNKKFQETYPTPGSAQENFPNDAYTVVNKSGNGSTSAGGNIYNSGISYERDVWVSMHRPQAQNQADSSTPRRSSKPQTNPWDYPEV